ncbi:MAG: aldo/keto reductase [Paenibacillaceae bacterium]|nr:aldo/keto reductase [Paenibacillaceae bacterium]
MRTITTLIQSQVMHGMRISALTLGTAQIGASYGIANTSGQPNRTESDLLLGRAIEAGVSCFDTAQLYGDSERVLGEFFADKNKPVLITKVKLNPEPGLTDVAVERMIRDSLESSLRLLRIPTTPALMLHNTDILRTHAKIVKKTMEALKSEGKIRLAGVSFVADVNDTLPPEWEAALDDVFETIQFPMNVLDQRMIHNGGLKQMSAAGKVIFVRSVYLQGLLFLPEERMPQQLRRAAPVIGQIRELAREERVSLEQLAVSFIRDLPEVNSLVIGAETAAQLENNAELINGPGLDSRTLAKLLEIPQLPESILNPVNWPKA